MRQSGYSEMYMDVTVKGQLFHLSPNKPSLAYLHCKSSLFGHFAEMIVPLSFRICSIVAHLIAEIVGALILMPLGFSLWKTLSPVIMKGHEDLPLILLMPYTSYLCIFMLLLLAIVFPRLCVG